MKATKTNIVENNKLIAEFMGWTKRGCDYLYPREFYYLYQPYNIYEFEGGQYNYEEDETGLKFHSSWDWLMPVVEKISKAVQFKTVDECTREEWITSTNLTRLTITSDIETVYNAVIHFVMWYSKQSK